MRMKRKSSAATTALKATKKIPVVRHVIARPRLTLGAVLGLATGFFLPQEWELATRVLVALDTGLLLYLVLAFTLMAGAGTSDMEEHAATQQNGRIAVLILSVLTAIGSLAASVMELSAASELVGREQGWHVGLAAATVLLSWLFVHTMFGMHYAHEYYSDGNDEAKGGLEFPAHSKGKQTGGKQTHEPDYWDFIHFSYVIGVASQTADIDITSYILRRVATLHCVVAFFFNTTVLALTVNIGASLLG